MREGGVDELGSTMADDAGSLTPSQELGSLGSMLLALARTEPVALTPGTLVADQYRIVRPLGEGGMGVVFLAHDVRLGRNVAVKVCTGLSRSAVHRIQREAMALAKLAHPNVVVVFQAGELDGRFFIAMEYVAGGTARSWLAAAPRQPREIVELYVAAGSGLAAAHAAGLVHRDFKPDNVLVGEDGRPRVADFGLVRQRLLGAEAHVALRDLRPRDAVAKTREQIALTDPNAPATILAGDQFNLALALEQADQLEEAMAATMRAIALASEALGEDHPMVARYRGLAAKIAFGRDDLVTAEALARRALETMERWFGPDHSVLSQALDVLAEVLRRQGRHDEALVLRLRNLELRRRVDPDSSDVSKMETNLAIAMIDHGRLVEAAPMAARSLARLERHHRHDHPDLVQALVLTGYIARERPDPDLAASRRDLDRALAIAEAKLGPDHAETVNTEIELAKTLVAADAAADAIERLERRLEAPPKDLPRDKLAEVRYMLARALAATGKTKQACTLAGQVEAMQAVLLNVEPVGEWRARQCGSKHRSMGR